MIKVLIVDDMKSFLDLERTFLRRADCHIFTATTGLEALKVAQQVHPDLILLDIEMPEMDGVEAARIFAATPSLMHIPVVVSSSSDRREDVLAAGAREFVSKPVDEDRFLELVQRYVPLKLRKDARKTVEFPCEIGHRGKITPCSLSDVSVSGIFVKDGGALNIGERLALRFCIPMEQGAKEIRTEGLVVRATHAGHGIGFTDLSEGARLFIQEFVEA